MMAHHHNRCAVELLRHIVVAKLQERAKHLLPSNTGAAWRRSRAVRDGRAHQSASIVDTCLVRRTTWLHVSNNASGGTYSAGVHSIVPTRVLEA